MGAVPQRASILTLGEGFAQSVAGASKHGSTPRSQGGVCQEGFLPHPSPGGQAPFGAEGPVGAQQHPPRPGQMVHTQTNQALGCRAGAWEQDGKGCRRRLAWQHFM